MPSDLIQPLNLKYILVDTFAGSPEVFTAIAFIGLCVGAGLFRMPNMIFMMMVVLAAIMLNQFIVGGIYLLVLMIAGISIFWAISRVVKN